MTYGGRFEALFTVPSDVTADVTTNAGTTTVTWSAGAYTPTSFMAHTASVLNAQAPVTAGTWSATLSTGRSGTGLARLAVSAGTASIAWTSTNLRDMIGFTADLTTVASATASEVHAGLWLPDCPMTLDLDPALGPKQTDNRGTESPSGFVITIGGTKKYQHKNIRYSHVAQSRIREGAATTTRASLEQWLNDTQLGDGHAWFSRGSAFQLYWDNAGTDSLVGSDLNSGAGPTNGWAFSPCVSDVHDVIANAAAPWLGMWTATFQRIVSQG